MMEKTMKEIFEGHNEGKHARQTGTALGKTRNHVSNQPVEDRGMAVLPTKEEKKATRRKTRFALVEAVRILVTTLFLFAVATSESIFFPFVIMLAVTGLLSLLEYESDDLE